MRYQGEIVEWSDERGFGYIRPRGSTARDPVVYLHISALINRDRRPVVGDSLTYEMERSRNATGKRLRAEFKAVKAVFVGEELVEHKNLEALWIVLALIYLFAVSLAGFLSKFGGVPALWVIAASLVCFGVYAWDKSMASQNGWRVSEANLHWLAFLGGWPGAALAQSRYRHKTSKQSFRQVFVATIFLNIVGTVLFFAFADRVTP